MPKKENDKGKSKDVTIVESESLPSVKNEGLFLTEDAVDAAAKQIGLLKRFVNSCLADGVDYGHAYDGAPKPTLLQPGAEKLRGVFCLSTDMQKIGEEYNAGDNYYYVAYRCTVSNRNGQILCSVEGSANSQEKKWSYLRVQDCRNTVSKIAQKRAFVGAIDRATNASQFFTNDIEDIQDAAALGAIPKHDDQDGNGEDVEAIPICEKCVKPMRISKYKYKEFGDVPPWYCPNCKAKIART